VFAFQQPVHTANHWGFGPFVFGAQRSAGYAALENQYAHFRESAVEIFSFLNVMVEKGGSDLFFSVGAPVNLKIEGVTHPLKMPALLPGQVK